MNNQNIKTGKDGKAYYGKGTKGGKAPEAKANSTDINSVSFHKAETESDTFVIPKVGDILWSGYGRNVYFYRVTSVVGSSMLTLERLKSIQGYRGYSKEFLPSDEVMTNNDLDTLDAGDVVPLVSKHKIHYDNWVGFHVEFKAHDQAVLWDGEPVYRSN